MKTLRNILSEPLSWLSILGLLVIVLGFEVGDLAQRVARASQLLTALTRGRATVEVSDVTSIADLLQSLARDVFRFQRWLIGLGLLACTATAFMRRAPLPARALGITLGLVLVLLLLLGRGLS